MVRQRSAKPLLAGSIPARASNSHRHKAAIALFILLAVARIVATYGVLNHTNDEPIHTACGVMWWTTHTDCLQEQPPLSRIAAGLGPYLEGARTFNIDYPSVYRLLYHTPDYWRSLSLARAGQLPFFVLSALIVALWSWRLFGPLAATLATLLYTQLPPVLAHAGLANTDIAATGTFCWMLYALCRWIEAPDTRRSLWLGLAAGAAIAAKFSLIAFGLATLPVVIALRRLRPDTARHHYAKPLLTAAAVAALLIWATYSFSFGTLPVSAALQDLPKPAAAFAAIASRVPVPAPHMFVALAEVYRHNQIGHAAYFLGEVRETGWWSFFPVVFALKTPLGFLLLVAASAVLLLRQRRTLSWDAAVPLLAALAILLSAMPARLNLGIRHILPMYPLLAIPAGFAAAYAWSSGRKHLRIAALAAIVWIGAASALSHPDYIPYFNELAGREPERIRTDSDLDWGQDIARLGVRLKQLGVTETIAFANFGTAPPELHGVNFRQVDGREPVTGWLAVSLSQLTPHERTWSWLRQHKPVERIGGSILLYNIPAAATPARSGTSTP